MSETLEESPNGEITPVQFPHYALQVRGRQERIVEQWLQRAGYPCYVPIYKTRRKWSDRVVEIDSLMFPGYVFCSFDARFRLPVLTTPGVIRIVGAGGEPIPVEQSELEAVRILSMRGRDVQPSPVIPGQKVAIQSGPLRGITGILATVRGHNRVVVSVSLLNSCFSAIVDEDHISLAS